MSNSVQETYADYERHRADARFTDWLKHCAEPSWSAMLEHRFVEEMTDGSIADAVFERYVIQERSFVTVAASALGYAVGNAPTLDEKRHLTQALNALTTDQMGYFDRVQDAHGIPPERWDDPPLPAEAHRIQDLVLRAATTGTFEEVITPMTAAEWLYLTWSSAAAADGTGRQFIDEWIDMHAGGDFERHAAWLRGRLDQYGPHLSPHRERRVKYLFCEMVDLEVAFHDAVY